MQHERGLEHATMLHRPTGELALVDGIDRVLGDEVPVRQNHGGEVANAIPAQLALGKVDAFDDEGGVLVVTIDQHGLAYAVARKLLQHILDRRGHGLSIQARGARHVVSAAALLLRFVAVGDGRRDQGVDARGDTLGNGSRQQHVRVHGHMRAMLLERANRNQHRRLAVTDLGVVHGPGQLGNMNTVHLVVSSSVLGVANSER